MTPSPRSRRRARRGRAQRPAGHLLPTRRRRAGHGAAAARGPSRHVDDQEGDRRDDRQLRDHIAPRDFVERRISGIRNSRTARPTSPARRSSTGGRSPRGRRRRARSPARAGGSDDGTGERPAHDLVEAARHGEQGDDQLGALPKVAFRKPPMPGPGGARRAQSPRRSATRAGRGRPRRARTGARPAGGTRSAPRSWLARGREARTGSSSPRGRVP